MGIFIKCEAGKMQRPCNQSELGEAMEPDSCQVGKSQIIRGLWKFVTIE